MSDPTGPAPSHRNVANIRPAPAVIPTPNSPHTPQRIISSAFGSPSSLRAEEDCVIIEIGARYLRAGFAGEAVPKSVLSFGPEEQRRAGDFRRWEVDYEKSRRGHTQQKSWGESHELWRPDLRGLDLGLVGDKIDRAMREAYTKHLLVDSRPRKMILVLPSALPIPLLSITLDTLFTNFQPPNISLMSAPVLATVAGGLRSALVIDVGWAETVVTAVYEYREVQSKRSVRGMKMLGDALFKVLAERLGLGDLLADSEKPRAKSEMEALPSFEECEDISERMVWCKPGIKVRSKIQSHGLTPVKEEDELRASMRSLNMGGDGARNPTISIPLISTSPPKVVDVQFTELAEPCESALFATEREPKDIDDEELPLNTLIYRSLLQLPVDARAICMSRIIFVGGGSNIPGLKGRILDDLANMIDKKGWDPVYGKAYDQYRNSPKQPRRRNYHPGPIEVPQSDGPEPVPSIPAAFIEQESDPIDDQLRRENNKRSSPIESGSLRVVSSLGAWSGGSLLSQLKIPAVSVVDREQWLQHGASGASKAAEMGAGTRQSLGGATAFKPADRNSWTLGLWG